MKMYEIIEKKRDKLELTFEEIKFFIEEYCKNNIPDYQASALLMAIYINGLTFDELYNLTICMRDSASVIDLSLLKEDGSIIIDKHSTGGVGDKVTLLVLPIVASLGVKVCKMSGKGLGYTGGTIDKLESIKGYDTNKSLDQAIKQINDIGVCLISSSKDIAIADKKLYALRDVTATVSSIDLIASSIMSKKLASGADKIILDVTVGSGAFMQNLSDAKKLANIMVKIGKRAGVQTVAVITSMEQPIGRAVGNVVEIKEVISFLLADESTIVSYENRQLREIVFELCAEMIKMAGLGDDIEDNKLKIMDAITSKKAYDKFIDLIKYQNGYLQNVYMDWIDLNLDMPVLDDKVKYIKEIHAYADGYITEINSKKIGEALIELGGGRKVLTDTIDYAVGIEFSKKVGEKVKHGDTILTVLYNDKEKFDNAYEYIKEAINIQEIEQKMANVLKSKPEILDIIR
ncbi:MAG: thymidine phosphorylase [Clostridia bacterium]